MLRKLLLGDECIVNSFSIAQQLVGSPHSNNLMLTSSSRGKSWRFEPGHYKEQKGHSHPALISKEDTCMNVYVLAPRCAR